MVGIRGIERRPTARASTCVDLDAYLETWESKPRFLPSVVQLVMEGVAERPALGRLASVAGRPTVSRRQQ
jgi:hypothetical protein